VIVQDGLVMDQQFAQLVDALVQRFAGVHERDTVARVVSETRARLEAGARVTTYLPILAARQAVDLLAGRASSAGPHQTGTIATPDLGVARGQSPLDPVRP
jgi:hypothetical protein